MNKKLQRKTKMNGASNLKARLLFVLAITFIGNSILAAGNNQNAGRKLDEIHGKNFFEFWSTNISIFVFFFGSSQSFFGVLAKLLCIYACFFLDSLVSYNGASNSWGLFVIEKFAVLLYLIQPSFSSSFDLLRSCIPMTKITPLLRQAYKLPLSCIIYILRGGGVCYSPHLIKYKYRQSK